MLQLINVNTSSADPLNATARQIAGATAVRSVARIWITQGKLYELRIAGDALTSKECKRAERV